MCALSLLLPHQRQKDLQELETLQCYTCLVIFCKRAFLFSSQRSLLINLCWKGKKTKCNKSPAKLMPDRWKKKPNPFSEMILIFPQFRVPDLSFTMVLYCKMYYPPFSHSTSRIRVWMFPTLQVTTQHTFPLLLDHVWKLSGKIFLRLLVTDSRTQSHCKGIGEFFSNI